MTKALDNVFPTAQRLLCTKHIKDNVSDHLKNSIGVKLYRTIRNLRLNLRSVGISRFYQQKRLRM